MRLGLAPAHACDRRRAGTVLARLSCWMARRAVRPPVLGFETALPVLCNCFPFKNVLRSSFRQLPSYDDQQFYFEGQLDDEASASAGEEVEGPCDRPRRFVLRVSNLIFPVEYIDGANALMLHLGSKGINCTLPVMSRLGHYVEMIPERKLDPKRDSAEEYPVRVLKFIPGMMISELEDKYLTPDFLYSGGQFAGRVNVALQDFSHPGISSFVNECWDLQYFGCLRKYISRLSSGRKKEVAHSVMAMYEVHIQPRLGNMKRGVIHGDLNGCNIIVSLQQEQVEIVGLIDFGDCVSTCYLFELATLVSFGMMNRKNPIKWVAPVIRGYLDVFPLDQNELQCLFYAILAHLCTLAVKSEYNASLEPENTHIQKNNVDAWTLLSLLLAIPKADVDSLWNISK